MVEQQIIYSTSHILGMCARIQVFCVLKSFTIHHPLLLILLLQNTNLHGRESNWAGISAFREL